MKRILIPVLFLAACGGTETDSARDLGVYYSKDEPDGRRVELDLSWEKHKAVVGRGTKQDMQTFVRDGLPEADIANNRALFAPELLAIYQADGSIDSGQASTDASISTVSVQTERLSPSSLFKFKGTPKSPEGAHMVSELDDLVQRLLATP